MLLHMKKLNLRLSNLPKVLQLTKHRQIKTQVGVTPKLKLLVLYCTIPIALTQLYHDIDTAKVTSWIILSPLQLLSSLQSPQIVNSVLSCPTKIKISLRKLLFTDISYCIFMLLQAVVCSQLQLFKFLKQYFKFSFSLYAQPPPYFLHFPKAEEGKNRKLS